MLTSCTESTLGDAINPPQSTAAAGTPSISVKPACPRPPFIEKRLWFWSCVACEMPVRTAMTPAFTCTSTNGFRAFTGRSSTAC